MTKFIDDTMRETAEPFLFVDEVSGLGSYSLFDSWLPVCPEVVFCVFHQRTLLLDTFRAASSGVFFPGSGLTHLFLSLTLL
jgi:hypothetical protein